ncbi:hypothetical protein BD410DRAFT_899653 [Rickenella mellea]|uniref:F-box domain-containing protein n=1 Tax=Rickenella mellea TaxID=50990 RepID=A0A4Y7PZ74_9AGAM|nr:hypothetical protein BD410DRAFT_899653 [Rickenella mellea]
MELATSLPLGLPDLPEELLEKICRVSSVRFRDPAIDHATPCLFTARPTETDLFSLRMTCKVLHRIATPLAWRRLEIVLTADEHPHSSERPYTDLAFLSSRHELARHIRCLGLQVSWGEKREETREAIERLLEVTTSLRAFHITRASFLTANSARILSSSVELLSIGDTWFLGDYLLDGQNAQLYDFKFSHLKALKMSAFDHRRDLSCYPNIQSLILHFKNPSVTRMTDLSLPWATIRELEIVACSHSVLTDIISELKSHLRTCQKIVLHTLSINTFSMQAPYAKGIIATFKTAKLQKLSFGGLFRDQMDTEFVSFIAETFPELVKVSLMVRGFGIWRDALDDYVSALKRLRHLKVLEWNNVDMPDEYDKQKGSVPLAPPDKNSNELPISYYQQEIKRLASHPSLEVVRHSSWHRFHHVCDTCYILRDKCAEYLGYDIDRSNSVKMGTVLKDWNALSSPYAV